MLIKISINQTDKVGRNKQIFRSWGLKAGPDEVRRPKIQKQSLKKKYSMVIIHTAALKLTFA